MASKTRFFLPMLIVAVVVVLLLVVVLVTAHVHTDHGNTGATEVTAAAPRHASALQRIVARATQQLPHRNAAFKLSRVGANRAKAQRKRLVQTMAGVVPASQ